MIERTLSRSYEISDPCPSTYQADEQLQEIEGKIAATPDNACLWMEKGLALSRSALYREAEECFAHAISLDPFNGIFYRHWAHRMLSQWRFEDARAGFVIASRLIPENWDVWYHLGLSNFLLGDYEKAALAYQRCLDLSKKDDEFVAVVDWYYMTEWRLGNTEKAKELLAFVPADADYGNNLDYFQRIRMYKGELAPEEVLPLDKVESMRAIEVVTRGFGVSNFYRMGGQVEKADRVVDMVIEKGDEGECYFAFGYLAALADKLRKNN